MIGRLKKMLGIDGLKVEIIASDIYDADKEYIDGELILLSKYQLVIESIEVRVIEKYTRGRFRTKKTDEYDIGSIKTTTTTTTQTSAETATTTTTTTTDSILLKTTSTQTRITQYSNPTTKQFYTLTTEKL